MINAQLEPEIGSFPPKSHFSVAFARVFEQASLYFALILQGNDIGDQKVDLSNVFYYFDLFFVHSYCLV
jgi:hypothetical protein